VVPHQQAAADQHEEDQEREHLAHQVALVFLIFLLGGDINISVAAHVFGELGCLVFGDFLLARTL
jgi:hypothetical protein